MKCTLACILILIATAGAGPQTRPAVPRVTLSCDRQLGPLAIDHIALGQGGLSTDRMFHSRVAEIRALRPGLIRLFVQEYYDLMPELGRLHFETLDRSGGRHHQGGLQPADVPVLQAASAVSGH